MGLESIDRREIGRILREDMAKPTHEMAEKVAAEVANRTHLKWNDGSKPTVTTKDFTTDRAVTVVRLNHPGALNDQAKNGVMTKSAAAVGLEVKSK